MTVAVLGSQGRLACGVLKNEGVGVACTLSQARFGEERKGKARRRAQPRQRGGHVASSTPQPAVLEGYVPLIVLGEPAEWLLMFPFAFGCRLGSVFSFPGWSYCPPSPPLPAGSLVCCGRIMFPDFLSCLFEVSWY